MPDEEEVLMSTEEASMIPTMGLDIIVLDELKEGMIITSLAGLNDELVETAHYEIKGMRDCMKDIYQAYSTKASKKEMCNILEKHKKRIDDNIHDFFGKIENLNKNEKMFKVAKKKIKNGEVIIKFTPINIEEKQKYVKSIVKKLVNKVSKEQLVQMFEQAVVKLNDIGQLKKADKALDKKNPKVEGKRGCYKLIIDDVDLMMIG